MRENFLTKALPFTLEREGGYTVDSGGETWRGISARQYPHLKKRITARDLTDGEIAQIYLSDYWIPAGCDALPYPLDCVTFDMAVNMGNVRGRNAAADAKVITGHLEDLFAALGVASGENQFSQAFPYLAAVVHVAERIGEYNILGGKTGYKAFREGWRNRAFNALKTFL